MNRQTFVKLDIEMANTSVSEMINIANLRRNKPTSNCETSPHFCHNRCYQKDKRFGKRIKGKTGALTHF